MTDNGTATPDLMIFAAGFGTRMGALTRDRPKPLLSVAGVTLLDRALAIGRAAGAPRIVVNTHYLGDQIALHLRGSDVAISAETDQILETGGGLRAALPLLTSNPVLTLNPDVVWTGANPLTELIEAWDARRMDGLLLVLPARQATGFAGAGDFVMDADGRLARANGAPGVAYVGAQLVRTDDLAAIPDPVFSMNRVWDRMIARGRAFGLVHQGGWHDVGRPEALAGAAAMLAGVTA